MARRRAVVTGGGGFLGRELCAQLTPAFSVTGADLAAVPPVEGVRWDRVDAGRTLGAIVRDTKPQVVVHAAFRNRKPPDWEEEPYRDEARRMGEDVFAAALDVGASVLFVSSSAVYGAGSGYDTIDETAPRRPVTPYGRAKAEVEQIAESFGARGLPVSIVRPFNLVGPRLQDVTFMSDWVRQALRFLRGEADAVRVRHRATERDFVDVRDAARAITMLASDFRGGSLFNIASGHAVSLREVSIAFERIVGHGLRFVETGPGPDAEDVHRQCGSSAALRAATGWRAEISWQQSLAELWRNVASDEQRHGRLPP